MRILFLTHYFSPEVNAPAARTRDHCRVWVKDGAEVCVLTNFPNHPSGIVFPGYKNSLFAKEEIDGISVYRLLTFATANRLVFKRMLNFLFYMLMTILAAPFMPKTDVVVSTSPQFFAGVAGYFVSRIKRVPWILEIRDLWPESAIAVGAISNSVAVGLAQWLERFIYLKADCIISVTESFVPYIIKHGGDEKKIHVIKNGVDLAFFDVNRPIDDPLEDSRLSGKFVAAYVGTHGMAHALETILHAADRLRDRHDIVFLLVGEGSEKDRLIKLRDQMRLENVVMLDQLPKSKMPAVWRLTDASLVLLRDAELFATVIPSKIVESFAMQRPVVLGVRGEAQQLVEESGAGICIAPENADELAAAVVRLADDRELQSRLGAAGRVFVERAFSREVLARRMGTIIKGVILTDKKRAAVNSHPRNDGRV